MTGPLRNLRRHEPIPPWVWCDEEVLAALGQRDIAQVYVCLGRLGMSQRAIATRAGQGQSEVSEVLAGRKIIAYAVLARIADGLGVPRGFMGLAYAGPSSTESHAATSAGMVVPPPLPARPAEQVEIHTIAVEQCVRCGDSRPAPVTQWSRREILALMRALRMSVREFARYIGVTDRIVSKWTSPVGPVIPRPVNQAALDTAYARIDAAAWRRYEALLRQSTTTQESGQPGRLRWLRGPAAERDSDAIADRGERP
jgi:transcriptional regulator with XRE-family HTH domain